jgi:ribosome-associated protein
MDIKKLQRIIVDALEDVKGQDIRAFNSTGLTDLFDRVVIATGTSNRHTKALANSVRSSVKTAGGDVLSMEGEESGEWVLVDLGDAIVHIMQGPIRSYYNLEEIWGDKPVALKPELKTRKSKGSDSADEAIAVEPEIATPKPAKKVARKSPVKASAKSSLATAPVKKSPAKKASTKRAPAKRAAR